MFTGCPLTGIPTLLPYLDPDTRVATFTLGKGGTYFPGSLDAHIGGELFDIIELIIQGKLNHGRDQRLGSRDLFMAATTALAMSAVVGTGISTWTESHFIASPYDVRDSYSSGTRYSSAWSRSYLAISASSDSS